jgi:hypothetical protein
VEFSIRLLLLNFFLAAFYLRFSVAQDLLRSMVDRPSWHGARIVEHGIGLLRRLGNPGATGATLHARTRGIAT